MDPSVCLLQVLSPRKVAVSTTDPVRCTTQGSDDWTIVTKPAGLEKLAEEAGRSRLRPRRLEHDLLWLSRTDHGEHSTCGAIAFYRENVLVSYLPFRIRSTTIRLRLGEMTIAHLPFRALQLYGDGIVGEKIEMPWALTALAEVQLPYDGLTLEEAPTESTLWSALKQGNNDVLVFERSRAPHSVIDFPSSYADYLQQLSRKTRENIRRHAREIESRLGHWGVRKFAAAHQIYEMVRLVEVIATKTFHYHLLGQDLTTSNEQFIRNLTIYAQQGWLRGYVLVGNDRPVAYTIGYLVNGCFQGELIGYDPEFAHASPGTLLLTRIVEDLINTGTANLYDFGAGDARYKQEFGNRSYEEGTLLVCRRTLYARCAATAERLFADASRFGARALELTNLKAPLKKFLRSKLGRSVQ
jgi:Acetyltransferase (GNAT) domain